MKRVIDGYECYENRVDGWLVALWVVMFVILGLQIFNTYKNGERDERIERILKLEEKLDGRLCIE